MTADELFRLPDDGWRYELDIDDVIPGWRMSLADAFD